MAPTAKSLAERLENVVRANHDVDVTIAESDYATPIVELGIGSLDLIEWAFDLETEFSIEIGDDELIALIGFSLEDAARWLRDDVPAGV